MKPGFIGRKRSPRRIGMSRIKPSTLPFWALSLAIVGIVGIAGAFADDEKPPKLVAAADAKSHIDESCTVEMNVRASKDARPRREYYLDSEEDFHDEKNFAVVISYDHAEKFKKAGIDNPADYYMGKKLRVTGKVIAENDQVRIRIDDPAQIKVVDAGK
jgi:hypothetical protein